MKKNREKRNETPSKKGSSFLSGVFLLTLSTMLVKATGLITKIPLLHLLGAEGMGYYNTAYEVYAFLFVLSTAGLPVALSILISERQEEHRRLLRVAVRLFVFLGAVGFGVLGFFADAISALMGNPGARDCMRAVAPAVLFICLASAVRGYYQGLRDMKPTAVSQLLEALGKLIFGLCFAFLARRAGLALPQVAAAGAAGLSAGTLLSLLYLLFRLSADAGRGTEEASRESRPTRGITARLLRIAIPITLSSGVITLTRLLDMVLILRRLQMCGYTETAVNTLYGAYSTLAVPLYSLLPTLIGSVALPLVPGIARAREVGDTAEEREVVSTSFRLTVLLGLPATLALSAFAPPILQLLFGGEAVAVAQAVPLLRVLGASVLSACLMTVTGSMLQAYHRARVPLFSMLAGSALKLGTAWFLLGLPQIGMLGAPISTFVCNTAVVLIDLAVLSRLIPQDGTAGGFCLRVLAASLLSVGGTLGVWMFAGHFGELPRAVFLVSVALCVLLYLTLILRMGALRREDVVHLSHGERVWHLLCRLGLVRSGENVVDFSEKHDKFKKST